MPVPAHSLLQRLALFFVSLAALAGSLLLTCEVLHRLLPFPDVPSIRPKYRWLAEHAGRYDLLFIGSSRFYHQIIPREFDALFKQKTGQPIRSFNASYDGMWPPESYYLLNRILALHADRFRWVVVEAMDIDPSLNEESKATSREAYWHNWAHTRMALDELVISTRGKAEQRQHWRHQHLMFWLRYATNMGRGADLVGPWLDVRRDKPDPPPVWLETEGFHPGLKKSLEGEARAGFETTVASLREQLPPAPMGEPLRRAMERVSAEIQASGAQPVYVIAPTLNRGENFQEVPGHFPLLSFNDPSRYPKLFDPVLHYDPWHLNEQGAHEFTKVLAEEFIRKVAPAPGGGAR